MSAQALAAPAARLQLVPKGEAVRAADEPGIDVSFKLPMTRREAEILFEIDGAQTGQSSAWKTFFVETLLEHLVFASRPTGRISNEDASWLLSLVGEDWSPSVPALMRALVLQAEDVPQSLIAFAMRCGAMRCGASSLV
ncbi:MAG TPA: hypothetical protein PLQ11_06735 [Beijerinckiaceae bacterium]|nr:hypothetical protein [Beijerinckiaceae bacterium]